MVPSGKSCSNRTDLTPNTQIHMIQIRIVNRSPYPLPAYATSGAAGMDLRAFLEHPVQLKTLERKLIPTGLFIEIPPGFEAQVRPRSGLAIKKGLSLVNSPGTIDSDYRGEIMIPVINLSTAENVIEPGDRIAQLVVARHETVAWEAVTSLVESSRGQGGFGHTGVK